MRKLLIFLLGATASGCVQFDPEPETHWVDISGANSGGDAISMNSAQCQLLAAQTQANAQASLTPIQAPPNCYDATCKMLAVMVALSQGRSIAQVGDNTLHNVHGRGWLENWLRPIEPVCLSLTQLQKIFPGGAVRGCFALHEAKTKGPLSRQRKNALDPSRDQTYG